MNYRSLGFSEHSCPYEPSGLILATPPRCVGLTSFSTDWPLERLTSVYFEGIGIKGFWLEENSLDKPLLHLRIYAK